MFTMIKPSRYFLRLGCFFTGIWYVNNRLKYVPIELNLFNAIPHKDRVYCLKYLEPVFIG